MTKAAKVLTKLNSMLSVEEVIRTLRSWGLSLGEARFLAIPNYDRISESYRATHDKYLSIKSIAGIQAPSGA